MNEREKRALIRVALALMLAAATMMRARDLHQPGMLSEFNSQSAVGLPSEYRAT